MTTTKNQLLPDHRVNLFLETSPLPDTPEARKAFINECMPILFCRNNNWLVGAGTTPTMKWISFESQNSIGACTLIIKHPESLPEWTGQELRSRHDDIHITIVGSVSTQGNALDIGYNGTLTEYAKTRESYNEFSICDEIVWRMIRSPETVVKNWLSRTHILGNYMLEIRNRAIEKSAVTLPLSLFLFNARHDTKDNIMLSELAHDPVAFNLTEETIDKPNMQVILNSQSIVLSPLGVGKLIDTILQCYHDKMRAEHDGVNQTFIGFTDYLGMFSSTDPDINPIYNIGKQLSDCRQRQEDIDDELAG